MSNTFAQNWVEHVNLLLRGNSPETELLPEASRLIDMVSGYEYAGRQAIRGFVFGLRKLGLHEIRLAAAHRCRHSTIIEFVWETNWTHTELRHGDRPRHSRTPAVMVIDFCDSACPTIRFFWSPEALLSHALDIDRVPDGYDEPSAPPPAPNAERAPDATPFRPTLETSERVMQRVTESLEETAPLPNAQTRHSTVIGTPGSLTQALVAALTRRGEQVRRLEAIPSYERFVGGLAPVSERASIFVMLQRGALSKRYDNLPALRLAMTSLAAAIIGSGVRHVSLVTDFSLGEVLDPTRKLAQLGTWDEDRAMRRALQMPRETGCLVLAYNTLMRELHKAHRAPARVHSGLVLGDSRSGSYEHNPNLVSLLERVRMRSLKVMPASDLEWLPAISADFAAELLASLPQHWDLADEPLWLFDPRIPPLRSVLRDLSKRFGVRPPPLSLATWLIQEFNWLGLPRALGVEQNGNRVLRRRYANPRVRELASRAGINWPDIAEVLARTADFHMLGHQQHSVQLPPIPRLGSPAARRERSDAGGGPLLSF
jgi:hypothetical protein